jgi:type III pantothenate kinase
MTNLVIDVGNSANKIAVFNGDEILFQEVSELPLKQSIETLVTSYQIENIIISSVKIDIDEIEISKNFHYIKFNSDTKIPICNKYKNPKSLGLDRLAAVIGASQIYPMLVLALLMIKSIKNLIILEAAFLRVLK